MKKSEKSKIVERVCPMCGKVYRAYPAVSRKDNLTEICPDCGTREALESLGIAEDEREEILGIIHRSQAK